MYANDPADRTDGNPYLTDRDAGFDLLGVLISHGVQTGVIDETDNDRLREFLADLQPQPLTRPFTPQQAHRLADGEKFLTAVVGIDFDSLLGHDIDSLNETASLAMIGNDYLLEDISYTVVGGNRQTGQVLVEVTGYIGSWLAEHLCIDFDECGGTLDDGEGYDGYCGNCADRRDAADDN